MMRQWMTFERLSSITSDFWMSVWLWFLTEALFQVQQNHVFEKISWWCDVCSRCCFSCQRDEGWGQWMCKESDTPSRKGSANLQHHLWIRRFTVCLLLFIKSRDRAMIFMNYCLLGKQPVIVNHRWWPKPLKVAFEWFVREFLGYTMQLPPKSNMSRISFPPEKPIVNVSIYIELVGL